ncbi:MAG TPA: hypothetical protein VFI20_05375 [Terracidiphilus sp.]|nr:hypothetical protein [Terracidiphilus sp.]
MIQQSGLALRTLRTPAFVLAICLAVVPLSAQQVAAPAPQSAPSSQGSPPAQVPDKAPDTSAAAPGHHITAEQARQLFGLVDQLIQFSSQETGFPIRGEVNRRLTTRAAVASYLMAKLDDDQDAKRMQQSEIVLKKFGLLDRDFNLKPFLIDLLKEQIEAYYDPKTKTVNLLDWVAPDEQKPVLAHELTHALQDQHINLDKWDEQTPVDVSLNSSDDNIHLAKDEIDAARGAVIEGQATAVMMDNILKPMGHSRLKDPEVVEFIKRKMAASSDSPVMARAPILLSESLMFPYRDGLSFVQDIWMDKGRDAAFTGTLDHPPTSTWEIINPLRYEQGMTPPIPLLPDIHPLADKLYRPYDIGQVGQLDVKILCHILGGDQAARDFASAWDGGLYWAGQRRDATPSERATTGSIALFYLSMWTNPTSAQDFARLYARNLGRKYSNLKRDEAAEKSTPAGVDEEVYSTGEGPVVITTRGKMVFIAESFPLSLARNLASLILDFQGSGAIETARGRFTPANPPAVVFASDPQPLTASFVRFFARAGVMKSAVDAALQARASLVEAAPGARRQ